MQKKSDSSRKLKFYYYVFISNGYIPLTAFLKINFLLKIGIEHNFNILINPLHTAFTNIQIFILKDERSHNTLHNIHIYVKAIYTGYARAIIP